MRRYPEDYNPILEYWDQIKSGEVAVSDKVRRTYKKIVYDIEHPGEYFYSPKRANHIIEFFENYCHHSKGKFGGKKVELELWEKAMLATVFGFIDINGLRKYREALLIVGKKNGKSLLASGVGLYMLVADSEPGPEVYAVATKRDQAKIIWTEAKRMVRKSPALLRRIKTLVAELLSEAFNSGTFKPLASDSDTLDGLNVHCALMDEIYAFFNTNQKIVTSSYTEDEWISYYEQCIEPVIMQMKGEYTRKIFSRRQRGCGNEIIFDSGDLTFSSMATKMKLVQMVDRRIMSPNEVRHYLNLPPVDGGDEMLLRKDTERQGTK